jgi:glycosyltransferase involved in cell wall biosynthesis
VVEATPGIAAARNRALEEAVAADLLVFIDDDERPHEGWLRALLRTHAETGAAAVAGAVVSEFTSAPGAWVAAGGFYRRRRLPTGSAIEVAATNNLLLDLAQVRAAGLRFDPRFGSSGGEDTLFTRSLSRCGARLVWCDEAVVTDVVPAERTTPRWVLMRAFSSGNSDTRVRLALAADRRAAVQVRAAALVRGVPRVLAGTARAAVGLLVLSRSHQARGLRSAARGAGMLAGAVGHVYLEYRR